MCGHVCRCWRYPQSTSINMMPGVSVNRCQLTQKGCTGDSSVGQEVGLCSLLLCNVRSPGYNCGVHWPQASGFQAWTGLSWAPVAILGLGSLEKFLNKLHLSIWHCAAQFFKEPSLTGSSAKANSSADWFCVLWLDQSWECGLVWRSAALLICLEISGWCLQVQKSAFIEHLLCF